MIDHNNHFLLSLNSLLFPVFVTDRDGKIRHANETAAIHCGLNEQAIAGMPVGQLFTDFSIDLQDITDVQQIPVWLKPSGKTLPDYNFLLSLQRIPSTAETKDSLLWLCMPVSKKKPDITIEVADLCNHLPMAVVLFDDQYVCTYANDQAIRLFETSYKDLAGKPLAQMGIFPQKSLDNLQNTLRQLETEDQLLFETELIKASGSFPSTLTLSKLNLSGGEQLMASFCDNSQIIQNEITLQKSEVRYKLLLDNVFDAIYVLSGNRFIYANKKLTHLLGYSLNELTSDAFNLDDTLTNQSRAIQAERNRKIEAGQPVEATYRFEIKDKQGGIHQVEISSVVIATEPQTEVLGVVRDITEQLASKKALEWEKSYFENLFGSVPFGIMLVDDEDCVLDINPTFKTMFGFSLDEIKGKPINDFIVPESRLMEGSRFTGMVSRGEIVDKETVRKRKDGSLIDVKIIGKPSYMPDGRRIVLGIYQDISERVAFNNQINNQKRYFEQLFQAIPYGIVLIDDQNNVLDCNEGFVDLFGYSFAELLYGFPIDQIIPSNMKNEAAGSRTKIRSGERVYFESQRLHKNGQLIEVGITGTILQMPDGQSCILAIFHDLTDRKLAEENLEFERRLMDSLLDNLPDTIYFKDTDSRFIRVNKAQAETLGVAQPEDAIGKTDSDFFNTEHGDLTIIEEKKIFLQGERLINVQEHLKTAKGWRWFTSSKVPIYNNEHEVIGLAGLSRDITELKELEETLIERENHLKQLNAEKDKLFSVIAHDLRSPFNSFLMLTEMLIDETLSLDDAESRNLLDSMHKSAANLYDLLENLLSWSMLQRGLAVFEPEKTDLEKVVANSLDSLSTMVRNKEIDLHVSIPADTYVYADQAMLSSILRNLISNALKFTSRKGKVNIIGEHTKEGRLQLSVEDSGIGMSPDLLDKLFSFESRGRKGTEGESSTGLGLIMVKEFVEKHQSHLQIKSAVGIGSAFSFSLQLA